MSDKKSELEQLQKNSLKPVGTVFYYLDIEIKIIKSEDCDKCTFDGLDRRCRVCICEDYRRLDQEDVIYMEVI